MKNINERQTSSEALPVILLTNRSWNIVTMPSWNQIQSQLRNPNNPVVFFDVSVGTTVSKTIYDFTKCRSVEPSNVTAKI